MGFLGSLHRHSSLVEMPAVVLADPPPPVEASLHALLPLVEPSCRGWQRRVQRKLDGNLPSEDALRRRFSAGLDLVLVLESARSVRPVNGADAEALGLTPAHLLDRAFQNLHQRTSQPFVELARGVYLAPYADHYDAARLALPRLLEGLELEGDPVVLAPNRATLLVTGTCDTQGLIVAAAHVRAAQRVKSSRVSTVPLRRTELGWQPWLPDARSPAREALEQLVHEQLAEELMDGCRLVSQLHPTAALPTLGTRPSEDGKRREVVVGLAPSAGHTELLLPRADAVLTAEGENLGWSFFARLYTSWLTQVEGTDGEWYRLALG